MFERFTERARRVVVLAQEEARMLNHNYIGTEHILLGLVREGDGVGAKVLLTMGLSLEGVRTQITEIIGRGTKGQAGHIPFTPRAKKVLELSLREAHQLGHNYIGTEHILLGLIREEEGVAAQVLRTFGAQLTTARAQVLEILGGTVAEPGERQPGTGQDPTLRLGPEGFRSTPLRTVPAEVSAAERRARLARIEELAAEEARLLGHDEVREGHRWLGYVRLEIEGAERDLTELQASLEDGRARLRESLQEGEGPTESAT